MDEIGGIEALITHRQCLLRLGIRPISFELARREAVFVYGGNGAGKTTLVNLLSGLYAPTAGFICAGGSSLHPCQLLRLCASSFQKPNLFWPPLDEAGAALDERVLEPHLARFGLSGLEMPDTEQWSKKLSGGQAKRLAILHVFLDSRPFAVFDEPTAEQDEAFRSFFFDELIPQMLAEGRGVLVVTHDVDRARKADVIVTMSRDHAAVVERRRSAPALLQR